MPNTAEAIDLADEIRTGNGYGRILRPTLPEVLAIDVLTYADQIDHVRDTPGD